ncbi:MAG: hypothetical protein M1821_007962 [Bathelium mastoideum]|nr:MAG: hypothetical protein M1821_007962 [Bathelium mastoideum]
MRTLSLATALSLVTTAIGQGTRPGVFLFPSGQPDNGQPELAMNYNDVLIASWTSTLQGPVDLILYGSDISETGFKSLMNTSVPASGNHSLSFTSIATITSIWPVVAQLKVKAREEDGGFTSHRFNISSTDAPPKTLMAISTGSAMTPTTPLAIETAASSTEAFSTATVTNSSSGSSPTHTHGHGSFSKDDGHHSQQKHNNSTLSPGAIIAIVVAIVVGGTFLLVPAIYFHLRRRRSRHELEARVTGQWPETQFPREAAPEEPPSRDVQYQAFHPSGGRSIRRPSNAFTTIVIGMSPSRRPTNASVSPISPTSLSVYELHSSPMIISEMPATPVRKLPHKTGQGEEVANVAQVHELGSENARVEKKEIVVKLQG